MCDYFRNCSRNANQVCCEDGPTKDLYNLFSVRWPCYSPKVTTASQTWQMFNLYYNSNILGSISAMAFKLGMSVDWRMAYMLMLVSMTLPLMQGHSGLAKAKDQRWIISTNKHAISTKLATTVGHFLRDLHFENVDIAWPTCYYLFSYSKLKRTRNTNISNEHTETLLLKMIYT